VFAYELAYRGGDYSLSKGRSQTYQTALVVRVGTDEGLVGWGETCPLGRTHLTAFYESEREALALLAPAIIGQDPRNLGVLQDLMGRTLLAGMGAKCAIDIACWDIFGQAAGVPVASLLGGAQQATFRVWDSIPLLSPERVAAVARSSCERGVSVFQVKVGDDPYEDAARVKALTEVVGAGSVVVADANGGWSLQNALIAAREMSRYPIYLEQPCRSMSNCAEVRRHSDLPMIVDECVGSIEDLVSARIAVGAGGLNLKPSRLGGLTPARLMRDTATELGMTLTIDDSWGGALTTGALSHLAISTRPDALLAATFFTELVTPLIADMPPRRSDGLGTAPTLPGLGLVIDADRLGPPLYRFH
jgi:L-alanine-DL-glutamate epimerase-like enolase superfamily enzyme